MDHRRPADSLYAEHQRPCELRGPVDLPDISDHDVTRGWVRNAVTSEACDCRPPPQSSEIDARNRSQG